MAATSLPILVADADGIWARSRPDVRSGIRWDEVYRVSGYRLDLKRGTVVVVTLDFDYGEFFEMMDDWRGFAEASDAVTSHLAGIDPSWLAKVQSLSPKDASVAIWQRA